ncbi:hypothetical protein DSL92_04770 [Billgrantia gudaonensis]|uniref:Uncharacterized protein n=1 Tax=Billgrantia gudaonensis TaxID=376427 RepID=A0A432JJ97_9GAMM|nr:hypothetical protein DSL92_04770 [Halomonas gudaonensis]
MTRKSCSSTRTSTALSEEDQEIVQAAADAAIDKIRSLKKTVSDEIRAEIEAAGGTVTDLTDEERQAWIDSAFRSMQSTLLKSTPTNSRPSWRRQAIPPS